ncbi:MAG: Fic family protein [Nitrospinae bacterium]|jgi:Fic family protein|nr:Fic family protein [Nitrospinota bacterium]MDA1108678.1 Fic family protein [Nitrospinota bacterium]
MVMTWSPKYTITDKLLLTIREIGEATGEIKSFNLTGKALARLELEAEALSSYASTSIEGNPLPLTDVKRLLKNKSAHIRDTEREVLNYNQTLQTVYKSVRSKAFKLNIATLEKVQGQVVAGLMDNPADCGHLRQAPVIIRNPRKPDEIVFVPPDAKDVRALTSNLIDFINKKIGKIDPVILAGLFHRQCVIIHPFMDGNGRTSRILTTAILGQTGLDLFEIFSFENYYNQNITRYFKAVGLEGDYYELKETVDFTKWLEYFADGILDELRRVRKALPDSLEPQPRLEPHHRQILEYIDAHGSITQREYGAISSRSLASRKLDFEKLLDLGFIEAKGTGRGTYYVQKTENG